MDIKNNINNIEEYKYPSNEFPKFVIDDSESRFSTRFESKNKSFSGVKKKVEFNKNVTVVNIQSYKKEMRKKLYRQNDGSFDEDFQDEHMKCFNCSIF